MRKKKLTGVPRVYFTDGSCLINGKKRPGIGLLVDEDLTPVPEPTDFLIFKAVNKNDRDSSVQEYGRILRMFWEFLSATGTHWLSVSDATLIKWRDMMETGQRVSKGQLVKKGKGKEDCTVGGGAINDRIGLVFDFYKWAMDHGRAPAGTIGQPEDGRTCGITANISAKGKWCWPYLLRNPAQPLPIIPVKEDIDELHKSFDDLFGDAHASRNRLIAYWMQFAGTRGIEVASLNLGIIPSYEEIDAHIEKEKPYALDFSPKRKGVRTKRGKARYIDIDPILLKITRDYIEYERTEIIENADHLAKKKRVSYHEPKEIFLNLVDGSALSKKTIQNEFSKVCKLKGLNLSPQGLRRYYCMEIISIIYLAEVKKAGGDQRKIDINTVILYAQQQLGHTHAATTIRSYINTTKLMFQAKSVEEVGAFLDQRKNIIERQLAAMQKKLSECAARLLGVKGLREAVMGNDKDEAMELLKTFFMPSPAAQPA